MEYLNANKNVFEKKLLIESRKVFMKLQKEAIMKKWMQTQGSSFEELWESFSTLDEPINTMAIDTPEEEDDDELDIF